MVKEIICRPGSVKICLKRAIISASAELARRPSATEPMISRLVVPSGFRVTFIVRFVVTVALITRFCVHEGLEQEKAYNLSDFYILEMDKCKTIEQISKLHDVMCLDFCKHMHEIKNSQVLSKQVVLCLDYIYSHTHYRITIREVAEYLRLSESYLSRLFKKEMGISFSQYILNQKIDKAKNLLRFSEYSIGEITYYLGFSNESHFIQTFQKRVGETPNRYRRRCFRTEWELKQN